MSLRYLDNVFRPQSIAVIGASEKADAIGRAVMRNLIDGGFNGELFPVNPKYDLIYDRRCYRRIADVPVPPELAVIAIPIEKVPPVVEDCVHYGVKGAVILSSGGREAGPQGRKLEEAIKQKADRGGMRIIGPNCLGIVSPENGLNASFVAHMPPAGKLAFISQSGAICSAMLDLSLLENMGYRYFISIGSMLDVDFGDLIDYVGNDANVSSVLLYIESLSHFRKFMSAVRAVSRMKPVVVLKAGRSEAGARAASSHTGAMAGDDRIYDAAFRRAGAVRVRTMGDFFDCAELLAKQSPPPGPRLTILTNSGGPGVMTADAAAEYGLVLSELSEETLSRLDGVLPKHWSRSNPVDILGDADDQRYIDALNCMNPDETDGLLIILNPQAMTDPAEVAASLADAVQKQPCRVFTSWMGGKDVQKGIDILNRAGIPTYPTPEQAVKAFRYLYEYGKNLELLQEIPPAVEQPLHFDRPVVHSMVDQGLKRKNGLLTELEAKEVLAAYAIPVNPTRLATTAEDAENLAEELGYPLAMKISSPDIVHKNRAGGVRLELTSTEAVSEAYESIMHDVRSNFTDAEIEGVTLQPMRTPIDLELLIGAKKDPNFGPVILFGWGGIHTEAISDHNIALVPINRLLARRLMEDTRVHKVLSGNGGLLDDDLETLEEMLVALSQLMVDFPQIKELDINPVAITGGRPLALDARIVVAETQTASPHHLAISPYPERYEARDVEVDGRKIFIRPIKPEDAPLLEDLFDQLSDTSIYNRFFSPMKSLPHSMLVRFTQIDYDREIAMVALQQADGEGQMLGVARVIGSPDGRDGEFAVVVADPWQGQGIGAELLLRSLRIVQERGMQTVWGTALSENTHMAKLARKLGFRVKRAMSGEYEMTIDLKTADLDEREAP